MNSPDKADPQLQGQTLRNEVETFSNQTSNRNRPAQMDGTAKKQRQRTSQMEASSTRGQPRPAAQMAETAEKKDMDGQHPGGALDRLKGKQDAVVDPMAITPDDEDENDLNMSDLEVLNPQNETNAAKMGIGQESYLHLLKNMKKEDIQNNTEKRVDFSE